MGDSIEFAVQTRTAVGKAVSRLRKLKQVPANIVVPDAESVPVVFNEIDFKRLYQKAGDTSVVYLTIDQQKTKKPAMIEDVQADPMTGQIQHVVFRQVNLKEKLTAEVPIELVGENDVPKSLILQVCDKVEVEALPTDFPDKIEVDISTLTEIGQSVTFAQLNYDRSKVTLQISEEEMESPVVMLEEVKEQPVEEPTEEVAVTDVPATAQTAGEDKSAEEKKEE